MPKHGSRSRWLPARGVGLFLVGLGCGPAPIPRVTTETAAKPTTPPPAVDPCAPVGGEPAPAPLARRYDGLARRARCQPEVVSIMKSVSAALGVDCRHCHVENDFAAPTPNKAIADWMSLELTPRLARRDGSALECASCHVVDGKPRAKILGEPRRESAAIEWMNTHMVADFERSDGEPLRCKSCHVENVGSPAFLRQLIGTDVFARIWDAKSGAPATPASP